MQFHNSVMDFFAFSKNTPKRQCISDYFDIKMQNKSWFEGTTTTPFIPQSQIWLDCEVDLHRYPLQYRCDTLSIEPVTHRG